MIDVEAGQVCFDIKSLSDVGTPNRGHIHEGVAGVNGGIVVPFSPFFELRIPPADPGAPATDPRNDALEYRATPGLCSRAIKRCSRGSSPIRPASM